MVSSVAPILNVLRRIAGVTWGNHPASMVKLHEALILNRMIYQLPFISPSETQYERLESLHRKGLRLSLGVPQAAGNN